MPNSNDTKTEEKEKYRVTWVHVTVFSLVQLTANLIYRFTYPYAPFIAPALGLQLDDYAIFLLAMDLASIACAFIILVFDKVKRHHVVLLHLLLVVPTILIPLLAPTFISLRIALVGLVTLRFATGMGYFLLGNILRSILGTYVPISERGKFMAIYEVCWNISSVLIGAMGPLLHAYGAEPTFIVLGLISLATLFILYFYLPQELEMGEPTKDKEVLKAHSYGSLDETQQDTEDSKGVWAVVKKNAGIIFSEHQLVAYFLVNFAMTATTFVCNTNFGVWLHKEHKYDAQEVGYSAALLGIGEAIGCLLTFVFTDRIGPKRAIYISGLSAVVVLFLFCLQETLVSAVRVGIGMLVGYFAFSELAWISGLSFVSVFTPLTCNKAISITIMMSCGSVGSLIGTAVAHPLYRIGGYTFPLMLSGTAMLASIVGFVVNTWSISTVRSQHASQLIHVPVPDNP
ncbi:hypothetical protein AAMO2058_000379300 [Amorphochlora amoebiformis]